MSAHDHPGLADVTDLAVTIAFLQRVLSVHEIASCHFDLRSLHIVYVPLVDGTAAFLREIGGLGGSEVDSVARSSSVATGAMPVQPRPR
jgi:hypothetical protein